MDLHSIYEAFSGLVTLLLGYAFNSIRDSMRELRKDTTTLSLKVQAMEVLVAGNYVTKDDMEKSVGIIFSKLDRIEAKLDGKADR